MTETEFLNIINPFKDKLFRFAKRLLISTEEAEDVTQEVILKLWKQKKKMYNYNNVEAFAMTITKNMCYDRLKSKQAQQLKITHSNYEDKTVTLQTQIETKDSVQWVSKLMDGLPERQRMVLQLRDIELYDFKMIETILNMNASTVRVTLSRARKTIREQLLKTHRYGLK